MLCPSCRLENPSSATKCDCGYNFSTRLKEAPVQVATAKRSIRSDSGATPQGGEVLLPLAIFLIVSGLACAAYFALAFDASVPVPGSGTADAVLSGRVLNLGLLQDRHTGITGGLELSILGSVLLLYTRRNAPSV